MSTNNINLNVHSYVYLKIHQKTLCSIVHLVSLFLFFLCECTINHKRGQVQI